MLNNFFISHALKENKRLKLALAIPTRALIKFTKQIKNVPLFVANKAIKVLPK